MSQRSSKVQKDVSKSTANKLVVICVDRDDDVGEKTGISTPVIGRDACIEAAQRLALEDPEDADSNSIFAAIKTYEDLISKGYQVEVATITGVLIPVFSPTSSSLSTQITTNLLAVDLLTSFCTLVDLCDIILN